MTRIPDPMEAPLIEAPFYKLISHLVLDDSYDTTELHENFALLTSFGTSLDKIRGGVLDTPAPLAGRHWSVSV